MYRVLLRFRKADAAKYISHLDLVRALEYAFRRAKLPIAYSEGFNPRPKMSFGAATGVGVESEDERLMLTLTELQDQEDIRERLNNSLPPGLQVVSVEIVPENTKSPLSALNASEYSIVLSCGEGCDPEKIEKAIQGLFASEKIRVLRVREKGTKEVDIRPYLLQAELKEASDGEAVIDVSLRSTDSGGARPQDLVQALSESVPNLAIRRQKRLRQLNADS